MFQPGTYKDGSLGTATQPGSYNDGSLGILAQPGAFRDGTLGAVAVGPLPGSGSRALFDPRRSAAAARARGIAAAHAAAVDAARVAAVRSKDAYTARYTGMKPTSGLGFATADVPFWGWLAGGVVLGAVVGYSLKR
jgi:hypothetical protein